MSEAVRLQTSDVVINMSSLDMTAKRSVSHLLHFDCSSHINGLLAFIEIVLESVDVIRP